MSAYSRAEPLPAVALLAGGLATRLRPMTEKTPKSMVLVAGEPFIAHQLRLLVRQQVKDVVICCGYLGEQIEKFVGDGSSFGLRVHYSHDGERLLGTGGAIKQALPLLGKAFFVMYGDSYLLQPIAPVWHAFLEAGLLGLMTVFRNVGRWDASNVEFRGGRVLRYEKDVKDNSMQYIDYGLGVIRSDVFDWWPFPDAFDLQSLYQMLVKEGLLAGYEVAHRFYEIGSHAGLQETDALLREESSGARA